MALNQNGGIFVTDFRFSETPFCVTQDSEAVEREKRLMWFIGPSGIQSYFKFSAGAQFIAQLFNQSYFKSIIIKYLC